MFSIVDTKSVILLIVLMDQAFKPHEIILVDTTQSDGLHFSILMH